MMLQISVLYGFFLTFVLLLVKYSSSKYLATNSQQINFMVLLHALIVPILAAVYFLQFDYATLYKNPFDATMYAFFGMAISYSIVSTVCYLLLLKMKDKHIIFHHVATVIAFTYVIYILKDLPGYWGMIVITQINPFFYHTYLILKDTEDVKKEQLHFWYNLNFYMWILVRIFLLGIWIALGIYCELTIGTLDIKDKLIAFGFVGLSMYFSINWLNIMIRNRKKMGIVSS